MVFSSESRRFLSRFTVALSVVCASLFLPSCKDDEEEDLNPPPTVYGSAEVNGSFSTFTRATLATSPVAGGVLNKVSMSRADNSTVELFWLGTELGSFDLPNQDTLIRCKFIDSADRVFRSDSGKIVIDDYYVQSGIITVSGGFEFEGDFVNPTTGLISNIRILNGGFVNVKSTQ